MNLPEGHPGQLANTFGICILSYLNFNILCLLLLKVSISVCPHWSEDMSPSPHVHMLYMLIVKVLTNRTNITHVSSLYETHAVSLNCTAVYAYVEGGGKG